MNQLSWFGRATLLLTAVLVCSTASSQVLADPLDPVRSWNEVALKTVRLKKASDAQAARLYAMVNVAMYDSVNAIGVTPVREYALVPPTGAPLLANRYAAAAAAAHAVLSQEYPDLQSTLYDPQLGSDLDSLGRGGSGVVAGQNWGASVGAYVRTLRMNDGSLPAETQPAGSGPGQFRADWPGAQFRNLLPFGIADSSLYRGYGPPTLDSPAYATAFAEVKLLGDGRVPDSESLATYQYWSLGSGTSQPPGAWIQVALAVTAEDSLPLASMTRLFTLVSMAMADTVAPTFSTKYTYHHWRPLTAIREADTDGNPVTEPDPSWTPRAGSAGSSPEYWSGHSSFSGAGAAALAGFYCNDKMPFKLTTDSAPDGAARKYKTFSAAANEAGRSRVLGGIHFEFSNKEALTSGRAVAAEILAKKLLLRVGPTHRGTCPL